MLSLHPFALKKYPAEPCKSRIKKPLRSKVSVLSLTLCYQRSSGSAVMCTADERSASRQGKSGLYCSYCGFNASKYHALSRRILNCYLILRKRASSPELSRCPYNEDAAHLSHCKAGRFVAEVILPRFPRRHTQVSSIRLRKYRQFCQIHHHRQWSRELLRRPQAPTSK